MQLSQYNINIKEGDKGQFNNYIKLQQLENRSSLHLKTTII